MESVQGFSVYPNDNNGITEAAVLRLPPRGTPADAPRQARRWARGYEGWDRVGLMGGILGLV